MASGSLVHGRITVDTGAYYALQKGKSLLAVGVHQIENDFETGEVIELVAEEGIPFAVAQSSLSSEKLRGRIG
ncbi:MAG: PUA domain-containing protein, partial [Bacteroidota bacterium]